jgi:hypothetical protein
MHKKTIISILLLVNGSTYLTGCGSLSSGISGGKRAVYLINAPYDLKVIANGEEREITREAFAYTPTSSSSGINYFTSGVKLHYKKRVQLELISGNGTAQVELKPKTRAIYHIATLFIFPIGGNIIDAATKNDKELYPRFIDVQAALSGINQNEWESQGKLKRQTKRKADMVNY